MRLIMSEVTNQCAKGTEVSKPAHEGSIPTPTQNKLIILVLPRQFHQQDTFIMMQNVCFGLKGEPLFKLSDIFVVLVT